jgi:transposase
MHVWEILSRYLIGIQQVLFPALEEKLGPLDETQRKLIQIVELLGLERQVPGPGRGRGRPVKNRVALARAFVAKMVYNMPTTKMLVERLRSDAALRRICGLQGSVPSEPTFSRAFAEFAEGGLAERVHAALIEKYQGERLVGHVSRDSTEVEGREKPARKPKPQPKAGCKRGRPRRGEAVAREAKRLELQSKRSLEENLQELPRVCDVGAKKNSQGHLERWIGYKLHLDVADGQIAISAILTSASLHDSQAAIPLAQLTARRVTNCYDLMDSAYDAREIRDYSAALGHVALIDFNRRRGDDARAFTPCQAERFKERTAIERVNGRLKEEFGGRMIRVRGAKKVMEHLMLGLAALTADQLLRCIC